MFANPAPSQNLKATSDFYQFFGLVSRLSCSHLFVVWFRVCQKGFELTGWKKIHRSDWNVSGESHASWDKVQRNVGNLGILFFFFELFDSCWYDNYFFSPRYYLWQSTDMYFYHSSSCLSPPVSLCLTPDRPLSFSHISRKVFEVLFLHEKQHLDIILAFHFFLYHFGARRSKNTINPFHTTFSIYLSRCIFVSEFTRLCDDT